MFNDELSQESNFSIKTNITITNGNQIYVEGIKKILQISDTELEIKLDNKQTLKINGQNIKLKDIQAKTILLVGQIALVSFEGRT